MAAPTPGTVIFQDDFTTNGPLNSANWKINQWNNDPNPSFLGQTQMRQTLPNAVDGVAKIRLDTFINGNTPGKAAGGPDNGPTSFNAFEGSEAITKQAWLADASGGIAFQGDFRFTSGQGGMITGFFAYEQFPWPPTPHPTHDEIDYEILTTQLAKISTNVFTNTSGTDAPLSVAVPTNAFQSFHTYRMEWYQDSVLWFFDGTLIRTESRSDYVPNTAQELHMNLWGVPGGPYPGQYGINPGDPTGPPVGLPSFQPAATQAANQTYYFDVSHVRVERLPSKPGTNLADQLIGTNGAEHVGGSGGDDQLNAMGGDDLVVGGTGNDAVDGGDGSDTAVFSGARSNYAVSAAGSTTTITDTRPGADADGVDNLTGVEFAAFADGLYAIGAGGVLTLVPLTVGPSTFHERVVQDDAYVLKQGQTLTVGASASVLSDDTSGTAITASLVQGPSHGTLQLAADGTFTYTAASGFFGLDSFTYRATDADGVIADAEVMLYVAPVSGGVLNLGLLGVEQQIASIYTGLLGRGADLDGFFYWANEFYTGALNQGAAAAIRGVAGAMGGSDEAKAASPFLTNPKGASDAQIGAFVDSIYNNLFDRTADAAGKSYWTNQVKQAVAANQAPGAVVANIISGAQDAGGGQDITTLMNKIAVNLHYVYQQFLIDDSITDLSSARALIDAVTSTQESVLVGLKTAEPLVFAPT